MTMLVASPPRAVMLTVGGAVLAAELQRPRNAVGVVLVPHGSGSSRLTPKNHRIARLLNDARLATLTVDLLTPEEEILGDLTGAYRTDAGLLTDRITEICDWITRQPELRDLPIALLASGSASPAALMAAAQRPGLVRALVVRGGRLDAAYALLGWVHTPTLLIVAEHDAAMRAHYEVCLDWIGAHDRQLVAIPRATAAFDEPHTLDDMAEYAAHFLGDRLASPQRAGTPARSE